MNDRDDALQTGKPPYWPGRTWRVATPEAQGLDSTRLLRMFQWIAGSAKNFNSLLIIRNGWLVTEAYFGPYTRQTRHGLASATKSVLAILIGIAMHQGAIGQVNRRVLELFPDRRMAKLDRRKQRMTLEHLLTMTAGLRWRESNRSRRNPRDTFAAMTQSKDWVQFVLDRPMAHTPGDRFGYNSGLSHLLSAILQDRTGMQTGAFAGAYLFEGLGVTDFHWESDLTGISLGGWGLQLTPIDMAKLGYLYLNRGMWQGRPVVPADWVSRSTARHVDVMPAASVRMRIRQLMARLLRIQQPPYARMGFGYHWWQPSFGGYAARGFAGQAIFVIPRRSLVVVMTGGLPASESFLPEKLMEAFILPAANASGPLPRNTRARRELETMLTSKNRRRAAIPPLPATAQRISGRVYRLATNPAEIHSVALHFDRDHSARLIINERTGVFDARVGLDRQFRRTEIAAGNFVALRGTWQNEHTFRIDSHALVTGGGFELRFVVEGERITIYSQGTTGTRPLKIHGRMVQERTIYDKGVGDGRR